MPIQIECISQSTRPGASETARLADMLAAHGRVALVVPSPGARDACRRALADAGCGVGVDVVTPGGWIEGLWELLGDGRRLVSAAQRRLLAARALWERAGAEGQGAPDVTPGMVAMLARAARDHLPYICGRAGSADLSEAEHRMVGALDRYASLLEENGLVEGSAAAVELAGALRSGLPACARCVALRGLRALPEYLIELIEAVEGEGDVLVSFELEAGSAAVALARRLGMPAPDVPPVAPAPVPLRLAEVCGPAARDASYARIISAAVNAQDAGPGEGGLPVAVACPDPLAAFRALAPRLAAAGIPSSVEAGTRFGGTRAGQALSMLSDLLERLGSGETSSWWPAPEVPDWVRSPFSGLSPAAPRIVPALDARLRRTRNLTGQVLMSELESLQSREANDERKIAEGAGRPCRPIAVKSVLDALGAHRYGRALRLMEECAAAPVSAFGEGGRAARQVELAALEGARAFMEEARALGVAPDLAFLALPELAVRASARVAPAARQGDGASPAGAAFLSLDSLAAAGPERYAAALLIDTDAESYPLTERDTPLDLLVRKLRCEGVAAAPAERQRAAFRRAVESAPVAALAYVARNRQAERRYPALAYAEAGEGLRSPSGAPRTPDGGAGRVLAAIDRAIAGLPDEGALFSNLDPSGGAGAGRRAVAARGEHSVPPELRRYLLLPERSVGSRVVPRALSASQIENYLSCPYRWLVSNRAPTRRIDAGFGPIEMGNFVHDVMHRFHERLIDAGLGRVRPETVDACLEEMDRAFEEVRADHELGKYTHGRFAREERPRAVRGALVPQDELERNRLEAMLPKLRDVVRYEADMLSIFTPSLFEYSFDKEGVTYAGRPIGGRIDRVDTAPATDGGERFVVIDYKNRSSVRSLGCADPTMALDEGEELAEGWLPGRDADRAPKVQALIYARALERLGIGSARGAVYLATRGPEVAGSVDDALVTSEPPAFPRDAVPGFPGTKPPRSRTAKHDGRLGFRQLLDAVESGVARELDALEAGAVAPRPASDSCSFCPITMCEWRRS